MSEWISVVEELPKCSEPLVECGDWVLGYSKRYDWTGLVCRCWISQEENICHWVGVDGCQEEVTHWMPLPEPPKEINKTNE